MLHVPFLMVWRCSHRFNRFNLVRVFYASETEFVKQKLSKNPQILF